MKSYLPIIRSLALFVGANSCFAVTTWTNFEDFNTNPDRNGVSLNITGGSVDANGHIILNNGNAQFNFTGSAQRPSITGNAEFSVAITYGAGSMDSLSPLFSSAWGTSAYAGLFGCSYNPDSQRADVAYWGASQTNGAFPTSFLLGLDPSKSLTLLFSKKTGNIITYSFYSDTTLIGSIQSTSPLSFTGKSLETLTIGGKGLSNIGSVTDSYATGSTMDILGLSYVAGSNFTEADMNEYFKQVLPIPEPTTVSLCALALASCMLRRRRN